MKRIKKSEVIYQLAKGITTSVAHNDKEHPEHCLAVSLAYVLWNLYSPLKDKHYHLQDCDIQELIRRFN